MRTPSCFSVLVLALLIAIATPGAARAASPSLLSPEPGAAFMLGTDISFSAFDDTPGKSVYVYVSNSPVPDADGLIGHDVWIGGASGGPVYTARWTYSELQPPGTYYWQAHRIDCSTPSYPDCRIESPVRTLTLIGPTAAVSVAGACYRENTSIPVRGHGFTPGALVDLEIGTRSASTIADATGSISASVKAPDMLSIPDDDTYELTASESGNDINKATATVRVAALALSVSPSYFVRIGQRVRYRFSGFTSGKTLYAHYRLGGRTRGHARLGRTKGACGTLSARASLIPASIVRSGTWTVQFDTRRTYSSRTSPRLRREVGVRRLG